MHLNAIGGVTILDALIEDDIRDIVDRKLAELQAPSNGEEVTEETIEA